MVLACIGIVNKLPVIFATQAAEVTGAPDSHFAAYLGFFYTIEIGILYFLYKIMRPCFKGNKVEVTFIFFKNLCAGIVLAKIFATFALLFVTMSD